MHIIKISLILIIVSFANVTGIRSQSVQTPESGISIFYLSNVTQMQPVEHGTRGGLARVSTLRKRLILQTGEKTPASLFVFVGDTLSPSAESNTFKGQQMIAAWNALELNYAVPGEHEFDFGPDVFSDRIKESKFPWLSANVVDKKTGKPFNLLKPYDIRLLAGINVGVFGLTLPDTETISMPGPNIAFLDPCETAAKVVKEMLDRKAQMIVALSHLSANDNRRLARCVPRINLIIGGHDQTGVQSFVGSTPVVQVEPEARSLGWLRVALRGGTLESMDLINQTVTSETSDDPVVSNVLQEYTRRMSTDINTVIGSTKVALDARQDVIRTQETNLGNYITDVLRLSLGADVALISGGSIRGNVVMTPGNITKRDVLTLLPFVNPVQKLNIGGADLRRALENGVSRIEDKSPRFPQVSGLTFAFDGRRPPGSRVVSIAVKGVPLDDKKIYTIATTKYLVEGGDGYSMFSKAPLVSQGKTDTEILTDAILNAKVIAPPTEGRIKRLDRQ